MEGGGGAEEREEGGEREGKRRKEKRRRVTYLEGMREERGPKGQGGSEKGREEKRQRSARTKESWYRRGKVEEFAVAFLRPVTVTITVLNEHIPHIHHNTGNII
jgi:hypothetical protein